MSNFEGANWVKSKRSGGNSDMCVEVAFTPEAIGVRDSKNTNGPILTFTRDEWNAFVAGVKAGEFDI